MKKLFSFVFVTLVMMCSKVTVCAQEIVTVTFNSSELYIDTVAADDGNDYVQILVAGAVGHVQDEGYPDLPVRSLQIIIPYGKKVENVTYSNIESQEFSINKRVYPVENYRTMTPFFAAPDTIIYNSSNCFPISPIVRWEQHYFDWL